MTEDFSQDFSHQNLQGRSFKGQNLTGANFSHADIRGANFSNAILENANFSDVKAGLPTGAAIKLIIVSLFLAVLSGFFSGITGSMELAVLQAGKLTAISASFIVLVGLPVYSIVAIRRGLESAFKAGAIAICLAMTLPVMLAWIGSIQGTLTGATTGILPGTLVAGGIVAGAGVLAVAIATAGLVSTAAALCVAVTGVLFIAAWTTGAIGFMALAITTGKGTSGEDLAIDILTNNPPMPELKVATQAVAGSVAFAGATVLMGAIVVVGLGIYLGWRILVEDEKYAKLRQIAVALAVMGGTNFQGADLTDANFNRAILKSTDFRQANLTRTSWFQTQKLSFARCEKTYLKNSRLRKLVTDRQGKNVNLDRQNLRGVNLQGANLVEASFIHADLSEANLQQADLSRAKLVRSHLERTNLTGACLTGACIENWIVSRSTQLERIECDYIYTGDSTPENRIPRQGKFKPHEFIAFIQSILDTLDLYHDSLFNSLAAVLALKSLSEDYQERLEIVGLEKRGDGIIIKVKTSNHANRAQLKQEYDIRYEKALKQASADPALVSPNYNFIQTQVSELNRLVKEIKQHPTTTVKYLYNQGGIVITGGDVNLNVTQTMEVSNQLNEIKAAINAINQIPENRQFAGNYKIVLRKFVNAIATDTNLQLEDKVEALEQIQVFIEAWQNPQDRAMQKQANKAINFFKGMSAEFPAATQFGAACHQILPSIATLLKK